MVWVQTNFNYYSTKKKLESSNNIVGDLQASKGRPHFYFKDTKDVTFQITKKGKLGIYFPEEVNYKLFLEKIKPFLTKADGIQAEVTKIIKEPNNVFKFEEADREEVDECIKVISKELNNGNKDVLSSRVDVLRQLSERKRVAYFPNVLKQIKECVESPMLVDDSETFKKLVVTLNNILSFEQYHKPDGWDGIVAEIQNEISPKAISVWWRILNFQTLMLSRFLVNVEGKKLLK